jgi:hypothetical protein
MVKCYYCLANEPKIKMNGFDYHPSTEDGGQYCPADDHESVPERELAGCMADYGLEDIPVVFKGLGIEAIAAKLK